MGVCCVKQHNQDQAEFRDGSKTEGAFMLYKSNKDAIDKIIKIQCAYRRYKAIKLLKQLKSQKELKEKSNPKRPANALPEGTPEAVPETNYGAAAEPVPDSSGQQNAVPDTFSENTKVRELEVKLGPFRPDIKLNDSVKREHRDTVILDNGARYTGEW